MTVAPREQTLLLGERKALVGVITQPAATNPSPAERPTVVMLNSGIIHRVGANRMNVSLARRLAQAGFTVVRFDLSGIGDSEPRNDGLSPIEAVLADIREVLDALQASRGATRFILMGLCSGADHAVVYAPGDPRVVGIVQLDPTIPHTRRYWLNLYGRRALRPRLWWRMLSGRYHVWRSVRQAVQRRLQRTAPRPVAEPDGTRRPPTREEAFAYLEGAYRQAVLSGVQFFSVFTPDLPRQHNYREQILDAFPEVPFGAQLRLAFHAEADHTFAAPACRERVISEIVDWACGTTFVVR